MRKSSWLIFICLAAVLFLGLSSFFVTYLTFAANHDKLTGLYNRTYLYEYLDKQVRDCERNKKSLVIAMFDIDYFKNVNDTYGHDIGDYVLRELSRIVCNSIRKCDVLSRVGGEEFLIIFPETKLEDAVSLCEKIKAEVENYEFNAAGNITISLGVSEYKKGDTMDMIIKRSDLAMYNAKNNGRNRVEVQAVQILN